MRKKRRALSNASPAEPVAAGHDGGALEAVEADGALLLRRNQALVRRGGWRSCSLGTFKARDVSSPMSHIRDLKLLQIRGQQLEAEGK